MVPEPDASKQQPRSKWLRLRRHNHHLLLDRGKLGHMHAVMASLILSTPNLAPVPYPAERGCCT